MRTLRQQISYAPLEAVEALMANYEGGLLTESAVLRIAQVYLLPCDEKRRQRSTDIMVKYLNSRLIHTVE